MSKTPKQLALDVLCSQLGIAPRVPQKMSPAAEQLARFIAGRAEPATAGTPEAELQALHAARTVEAAPSVINRQDLIAALADHRSPTAVLVRDIIRTEMARVKAEGGE